MLKEEGKMSFKNDNSYKVMDQKLDIHTIKIGVIKVPKEKAMDYMYIKVLFKLNKKIID